MWKREQPITTTGTRIYIVHELCMNAIASEYLSNKVHDDSEPNKTLGAKASTKMFLIVFSFRFFLWRIRKNLPLMTLLPEMKHIILYERYFLISSDKETLGSNVE